MKLLRDIFFTSIILFTIYSVIVTILFYIHLSLREATNYLDIVWYIPIYLLGSLILLYMILLFGASMIEPVGKMVTHMRKLFSSDEED